MTTPKNKPETAGSRGGYNYMQLLSDFELAFKKFDWMEDAACRGMKGVNFFPEESFNAEAPKAVAVCKTCSVRADCLEFAVENFIWYGIWGGMTPLRRKQYLRAGRPADMLDK